MEFEAVDEGIVGETFGFEGSEGVEVNNPIAIILDDGEQLIGETTNLIVQEEPKTNNTEEAIVQVEQSQLTLLRLLPNEFSHLLQKD